MSVNPNYNYLRFACMPFHTSLYNAPVSAYRVCTLSKRLNRCEFADTVFTIPAGGELEVIFMDTYINGGESEHIAFFVQVNSTPTSTIQPRISTAKRFISNKPSNTTDTCYLGGYFRLNGGSGNLTTEYRFYEPVSVSNPSQYSNINNAGTTRIRQAPNNQNNNAIWINCLPTELKNKRFSGSITSSENHRMVYHAKVKNNGTSSATCSIQGAWWIESQDPAWGGITYSQDNKCPSKLAEYVISYLRTESDAVYCDAHILNARFDRLDSYITQALQEIVYNWKAFVVSRNQVVDTESEEIDWNNQPMISNN